MIIKDGKEVHPLRQSKIILDGNTYYEGNAKHNRSWFILDLALPGPMFVPAGSSGLTTADGLIFGKKGRRE